MERIQQLQTLNEMLLAEMPEYKEQSQSFPYEETAQRQLLRSLMNIRPPMPLNPEFVVVQNELLSSEREEKGVVDGDTLPVTAANIRIAVWQGVLPGSR